MKSFSDDQFNLSVLASGSTGNATYIETNRHKLLVDCGFSGKKLAELMQSIGRDIAEVDSLLITHEHTDHIKGLGVLARRYGINVYANSKTWQAMANKIGKIPLELCHHFENNQQLLLDDLDIVSYRVSHDAVDPQFYTLEKAGQQVVILTDTGYVSQRLRDQLKNATAYLIETNHDVGLLRNGAYPWHLKQRILSDEGHLSNEDGALAFCEMAGPKTKFCYLGHLSQENNMTLLANETCQQIIAQQSPNLHPDFSLRDTSPTAACPLQSLLN